MPKGKVIKDGEGLQYGFSDNEYNRGMGLLGDSEERLRLAADYLKAHKIKTQQEKGERLSNLK